jgi:hypothetical protein
VACAAAILALAGLVNAGCVLPVATGSAGSGAAATGSPDTSGNADATSSGGGAGAQDETPQDQVLDIEVVHPNGMTLSVSKLSFTGNDIFLDVEMINSSRYEVTLHIDNVTGNRLRLVDDAGQEYNFVEPESDSTVSLVPGETLNGTLAFRGPLRGEPEQLSLVANLYPHELPGYDIKNEHDSAVYPAFAVPMDLMWP